MRKRIGEAMTIQEMIEALVVRGWTQQSIAEAAVTTQPTIHRAAKGASVRYETGKAIERLYESAVVEPESILDMPADQTPKQAA